MMSLEKLGAIVISVIVMTLFSSVITMWFFFSPPADSQSFGMLVGTLNTLAGMVVGYWVGSSAGSRKNQETISTMAVVAAGTGNGTTAP